MNLKKFKSLPFYVALCAAPLITYAQKKKPVRSLHTGYIVHAEDRSVIRLRYSVSYKKDDEFTFVTTYKLFLNGEHQIDIIAKHISSAKKVTVEVAEAGGGIFASQNTEDQIYDVPTLKPFGFRGTYGALAGNKIPNQLTIKFKDKSYTYVDVVNVLGYHSGNGDADFYVLN